MTVFRYTALIPKCREVFMIDLFNKCKILHEVSVNNFAKYDHDEDVTVLYDIWTDKLQYQLDALLPHYVIVSRYNPNEEVVAPVNTANQPTQALTDADVCAALEPKRRGRKRLRQK